MTWTKRSTGDKPVLFYYDVLGSTNKTAKELAARPDTKDMTVVIADRQTEGVGRRGKSFYSPEGGIYASYIFKPDISNINDGDIYTMGAAVAACEAIEKVTGRSPEIKWINDLLLNDKKICGILTEARPAEKGFEWVVVGIGINLYLEKEVLPEDIKERAGGIFDTKEVIPKKELTAELTNRMQAVLQYPKKKDISEKYLKRLKIPPEKWPY